jgi:hypothetical protein
LFGNQVRCSCRISLDLEARRLLHASKIQRFLAIHCTCHFFMLILLSRIPWRTVLTSLCLSASFW